MRTILLPLALTVLALSALGCGQHPDLQSAAAHSNSMSEKDSHLVAQVELDPVSRLNEPLKMRWKIFNAGVRPEYVYSTLLQPKNNALAEIDIDTGQRLFEVRFLRLNPFPRDISPNSFPETEFERIEPGKSIEGYFISSKAIREITNTEVTSADPLHEAVTGRLTAGTWKTRSLIAYGDEIESVQNDLKTLYPHGRGHPLAAIVKWQKVAYSQTVSVTFQE